MFIGNTMGNEITVTCNNKDAKSSTKEVNPLKNGVINASTLKLGKQDEKQSIVEEKKQKLKKQAQDIINKAMKNREKKLAGLEEMQNYCKTLEKECEEETAQLKDLKNKRNALMEEYSIEADSEEEQELKYVENLLSITKGGDEVEEKLTANFTDYQKLAFEMDKMSKVCNERLKSKQNELQGYQEAIIDFKNEDVKDHSMIDAYKESEELLKKGNKEIINQITKEAVEEQEKKTEEEQEALEEKREDQKIQEAKEQKLDSEINAQEANIGADSVMSQMTYDRTQQKLLKAVQESNLSYEDIKGMSVDDQA